MPAAAVPASAVCQIACGIAFCIWPASPIPGSTTIAFAKNFARSKASPSGARISAVCRALTHRRRRLARTREGEMLQLDASVHRWLEDRGPQLTLLGFLDDVTPKVLVADFFPPKTRVAISACSTARCAASAYRLVSKSIVRASSFATTITGRSKNNSRAASPRSLVAPSSNSASPMSPPRLPGQWPHRMSLGHLSGSPHQ